MSTDWKAIEQAAQSIRAAVDRRKAEESTSRTLLVVLFGAGLAVLISGIIAGFMGNQVLMSLLIGGGALANSLLFFPIRELRRTRDLNLVLEVFPAMLSLGPGNPEIQTKLVKLLDNLINLVERGQ